MVFSGEWKKEETRRAGKGNVPWGKWCLFVQSLAKEMNAPGDPKAELKGGELKLTNDAKKRRKRGNGFPKPGLAPKTFTLVLITWGRAQKKGKKPPEKKI